MRTVPLLLALIPTCAAASASEVFVVNPAGSGTHNALQPAIEAALDGDVILIQPGSYPFSAQYLIDNKALTLVLDGVWPSAYEIAGWVLDIRDLAPDKELRIAGPLTRTLTITDCEGHVVVEGWRASAFGGRTQVSRSSYVTFVDCTFLGADGAPWEKTMGFGNAEDGDPGLEVFQSTVALYDCVSRGGRGGDTDLFISQCPGAPGNGGPGIAVAAGAVVRHTRTEFAGGPGGTSPNNVCGSGWTGPPIWLATQGSIEAQAEPGAELIGPSIVREGATYNQRVVGQAGGQVYRITSSSLQFRSFAPPVGTLHIAPPLGIEFVGVIPPSGLLLLPATAPALGAGDPARTRWEQVFVAASGARVLSNPKGLVVVDDAY